MEFICSHCGKIIQCSAIIVDRTHFLHTRCEEPFKKKRIMDKVNDIKEMAKNGPVVDWSKEKPIETSLSKVIRTQEEANVFMRALNALR